MDRNVLFVGAEPVLIAHLKEVFSTDGYNFHVIKETGNEHRTEQEIIQKINDVVGKKGKIDILIIGALYKESEDFNAVTFDSFERYMHISVHTPFLYTKACVRKMERHRFGRVIILTSTVSQIGDMDVLPSIASGCLETFVKSTAREEARKGITINCLSLGYIDDWKETLHNNVKNFHDNHFPLKAPLDLSDVALEIKELSTSINGKLNGQIIQFDGGTL